MLSTEIYIEITLIILLLSILIEDGIHQYSNYTD